MNVACRCCMLIFLVLQWVADLVRWFRHKKEFPIPLPELKDPLLQVSATTLAERIRRKQISSEELVKAYIKRIKEVNPIINAVVEDRFDGALADARNVDQYLKVPRNEEELRSNKPLLGIPITVKECLAVKGLSYTACSKIREGIKADEDCDVILLLKAAGAIPLLVSATPEYCTSLETENYITGTTRNPYNTLYSSGGSSGGEGALLGAGASMIGVGSDIGGSIRIPCAYNGIFGHKATSGIVPLRGHFPFCKDKKFSEYLALGPMTRHAEDLKLAFKVIAGDNALILNLDENVDLRQLKIFFMEDSSSEFGLLKVDREIKNAIRRAVAHLKKSCKCVVSDVKFPEMGESMELCSALIFNFEDAVDALSDSEVKYNLTSEFVKKLFGRSIFTLQCLVYTAGKRTKFMTPENVRRKYLDVVEIIKEKLTTELGRNGILLYPNFPTSALKHGKFFEGMSAPRFAAIFNLLGFPATCVPVGLNREGLPIGIQVVAAPYQDRLCLAVAEELEKYFGGWRAPC